MIMEQQEVIIEETEQPGIWFCRYDGFEHKLLLMNNGSIAIWRRGNYGYGAEAWSIAQSLSEAKEKIRNAKNKYRRINV